MECTCTGHSNGTPESDQCGGNGCRCGDAWTCRETALSGSSLAGQVQYIMTLFLFGLTSGATVLTAQYWGKTDLRDDRENIRTWNAGGCFGDNAVFLAAQIMPRQLLQIFTSEPAVVEQGVKYLRIIIFSYIFMGITQTYLYIMRSVERVVVATVVYLCSLICNITINAVLIFGLFGMPAMGVQGAAVGTLVSRILELILVCVYSKVWNKDINFRVAYFFRTEHILNIDFLKYAFPVVLNEALWGWEQQQTQRFSDIWGVRQLRQILWHR